MLRLDRVDRLELQRRIDLGPRHRRRRRAERAHGLEPYRRAGRAHAHALEVGGLGHRLVGQQMALALEPVERENLVARGGAQLGDPFLEQRRRHELAQLVEVLRDIGRAEDAELLHVGAEPAAVDDHGNAGAGARLLQHVLVRTELRAGEQLDLDLAVRALRNVVAERLEPLEQRIVDGQRRVDVEREIRGEGRRRKCERRGEPECSSSCPHDARPPFRPCLRQAAG